jgi:amidase
MKEPCDLTAVEAISRIVQGKLTRAALVASCAERIKTREPQVQAWQYLDIEAALELARARDKSPRNDVLQGIPFGVKDIIETADMPLRVRRLPRKTTMECGVRRDNADAGGILPGKAVTTEFASSRRQDAQPLGSRTPGGLSSGSAAAVAAAWYRRVRHRPAARQSGPPRSRGRRLQADFGDFRFSACASARSFDTLGLIARSLEDVELFRAVLLKERGGPRGGRCSAAHRLPHSLLIAEESTQRMLEDAAAARRAGAKVNEA